MVEQIWVLYKAAVYSILYHILSYNLRTIYQLYFTKHMVATSQTEEK